MQTNSLIDIGANLGNRAFALDLPAVLERAQSAGVVQIVITGTTVQGSIEACELAKTRPGILFSTAGVHPHHASELDDPALARLAELLSEDSVVANITVPVRIYQYMVMYLAPRQRSNKLDNPPMTEPSPFPRGPMLARIRPARRVKGKD